MIEVILNQADFEYDIRALIRAFFPKEEVKIRVDSFGIRNSDGLFLLEIEYLMNEIHCSFITEEKKEQCSADITGLERKEVKKTLKRLLYHWLEDYSKQKQLWGDLTGIRPVKIVLDLLERGESIEEAKKIFQEEYLVSDEKTALSLEIAEKEQTVIQKTSQKQGYSLYIHIPFCPSTCLYCSFTSNPIAKWKDKTNQYLDCVEKELDFIKGHMGAYTLDSVYIGGGTPTTLEPEQLERLFFMLEERFDMQSILEFTVEAGRPDSITKEKLLTLKRHQVSRISINPQTMNDATLKLIGRAHTVEDIRSTFQLARECGFDCINMDLILGLPGETQKELSHTLKEVQKLKPDNLTIHSLAIKRAARLNLQMEFYEKLMDHTLEEQSNQMNLVDQCARALSMEPYYLYRQKNMAGNLENVGYAVPGKEGIYNIMMMEEQQTILAVGAGASTKIIPKDNQLVVRVENVKDVNQYMERLDEMIARKKEALIQYGVI